MPRTIHTRLGMPVCQECDETFTGEGTICGRCKQNMPKPVCHSCKEKDAEITRLKRTIHSLRTLDSTGEGEG